MAKRIGEILVEHGFLTSEEVDSILEHAKAKKMRFGEAGMEIGILTTELMTRAFGPNFHVDLLHIDPNHFPESTKDFFSKAKMIEWGAIPLGIKQTKRLFKAETKTLKVGMLNPARKDVVEAITASDEYKGFDGLQIYLVLPHEFIATLEQVYQIPTHGIGASETERVDPTLRLFLAFP